MALASLAYLAMGAKTGGVRREPTHLRASTDSDEPWKAAIEDSISNFAHPSPVSAVSAKANNGGKGDKGDKESKKKTDQPVSVQVPENEIDHFISTLSKGCGGRFKQMLNGEGTGLHKFGSGGSKADGASCKKLEGTLCATQAHIIHEKKSPQNGRKMEQITDVSGNSCLPSECMSKTDLTRLSTFMHTQAKNIIPGAEHRVELHVDCTKNGGTIVTVGVKEKSGSASLVPAALTMVLALLAARL